MANFNEHSLEMSIMELFQDEGYIYLNGEQIHRERSEVLLILISNRVQFPQHTYRRQEPCR